MKLFGTLQADLAINHSSLWGIMGAGPAEVTHMRFMICTH